METRRVVIVTYRGFLIIAKSADDSKYCARYRCYDRAGQRTRDTPTEAINALKQDIDKWLTRLTKDF